MKNVSVQDGGLFLPSSALFAGTQGRRKLLLFWFHYLRFLQFVSSITQYKSFTKLLLQGKTSARPDCLFHAQNIIRLTNPGRHVPK